MKKKAISLIALSIYCMPLLAQSPEWDKDPVPHQIPDEYKKESAVIVQDMRNIAYKPEDRDVIVYKTVHRIIKVQDDKGVESFNKAYIPVGALGMELIKARTVTKDKKVFEVAPDKIKTVKDENGRELYLVAFEGVEKDAEVEVLYTEKKPFNVFGLEDYQYSLPSLNASFTLKAPERFRFETKGYNGYPTATEAQGDGMYVYKAQSLVKGQKEESYSNSDALSTIISYRLSFLTDENPDVRLFSWRDLIKKLYDRYYTFSEKETRATEKFLESIGVKATDSEIEKIRKIEDAIKTGIQINKDLDDEEYVKIDKTITAKTSTEAGTMRLYTSCFTVAKVKHEMGITSDRYKMPVDEDFESWNGLDEFVLYFPNQDIYTAPMSIYYRYPMVPTSFFGNKGIFCKLTTVGNLTSAVPDIREIAYTPGDSSQNNIIANVSFKTDELEPEIDMTATFTGCSAFGLREISNFVEKDKEKEFVQQMVHIAERPEDIATYKISGKEYQNYTTNKPLEFTVLIKAPQLIEKAGNKYLFKIGEVIGNQQELYQTEKREQPIDLPYPHYLNRTITVNIPSGYKVTNAETLKINAGDKDANGKETMAFHSSYKMEGKKLRIDIQELYTELNYDISTYDIFAKVINAAADFNKVVLVLEKE